MTTSVRRPEARPRAEVESQAELYDGDVGTDGMERQVKGLAATTVQFDGEPVSCRGTSAFGQ